MSEAVESRIARIESDVQHINKGTADLQVELRRTNDRIDVTNTKMESGFKEVNKKIDDTRKELTEKIDDGLQAANKKIEDVHHSLKDKLHSMTIWALLLYVTLAGGLLTLIGRAFKWI